VFGVWSGTSFEATLLNIGRSHAQWMLLAVMLAGLFMNAAIADAFDTGGWTFVLPLLVIQAGRAILMIVAAHPDAARALRAPAVLNPGHDTALDHGSDGPGGGPAAVVGGGRRDRPGRHLAGPPRARPRAPLENVEFDADHMIERCRLFLLIALGGSVLTSGTAIADAPRTLLTLVTGTGALATIVAQTSVTLSLLLFGGPLLYLLSQTVYLWAVAGRRSLPRLAGSPCWWWPAACPTCSRPPQPWACGHPPARPRGHRRS
jgi:Bacterial low temperature requirement A protein (LtrA)